jgi:hypothetical protein
MRSPARGFIEERKLEETAHNDMLATCWPVRTNARSKATLLDNALSDQWPRRMGFADPFAERRSTQPQRRPQARAFDDGQAGPTPRKIAMYLRPYDPTPGGIERGDVPGVNVQSGIIPAQIQKILRCVIKTTD